MTVTLHPTRQAYLFDRDLAAHITFAEIRHYARAMNPAGRTEDEVQTFTRRLAWLTDRDLNWCDVDNLISRAAEYADATDAHSRWSLLLELFWEITTTLGTIRTRWENS